ncbi:MAG: DnaD domain protein [Firmicutes bacterium]|nr:DnaD domain protein [Bacillota bacterium]
MNNRRKTTKEYYLFDTNVENMFINEYMPNAPGDYVKVYLFALMYADLDQPMTDEMLAKELGMQEEDVREAWDYWEELKVIHRTAYGEEGVRIEFLSLKEQFYGKSNRNGGDDVEGAMPVPPDGVYSQDDLKSMFEYLEKVAGKAFSGTEIIEILNWVNETGAAPEVVMYAYRYCYSKKKTSIKYIATVVQQWTEKGLRDVEAVDDYLADTDQRRYQYRRIFRALGFIGRAPTEEEMRRMDSWFDEMGFTIDKVLDACSKTSGISNPNINYVDSVLKNWKKEADQPGSRSAAAVGKYYEYIREEAEKDAEKRRREVLKKLPRIQEIDDELNELSREATKLILSGSDAKKGALDARVNGLLEERAVLMTDNGFPMDYMDVKYQCDKCRDTGFTDTGERCSCYEERAREAAVWESKS